METLGDVPREAPPPTYYGLPAVKPPTWGYLIATYFFVGGLAGASQVIAMAVDLLGRERDRVLVSSARYVAILGAAISPVLLIADLHSPRRWYNMLRIYRGTSPMSIGSWTLTAFGTFSGLAAAAQAIDDLTGGRFGRREARWLGVPAGLAGAMMSIYTGTLLSATSTPLWAGAYRLLPPLFGASATATAGSLLSLLLELRRAPVASRERLERVTFVASAAELALTVAASRTWRRQGLDAPLEEQPLASAYHFGALGAGIGVPLVLHAIRFASGRPWPTGSLAAAIATLAGGYIQRSVLVMAGKRSAQRPEDYFRYTRAGGQERQP